MKKLFTLISLVLCVLSACAPPQPEQEESEVVVIAPDTDILEPIPPTCNSEDYGPQNKNVDSPVDASSPITFSWDIDCRPDEYEIFVHRYDSQDTSVWQSFFDPGGPGVHEWIKLLSLEPATTYRWKLNAYIDGNVLENIVEWDSFVTGPYCNAGELVAPTLLLPADGTIDTGKGGGSEEVRTSFKYPFGECAPWYLETEFSLTPDFSEGAKMDPGPTARGKKEGEWLFYLDDSTFTENCNLYYWHVRAVAEDGHGDWSETFNFYLDVYGNCYPFPEFNGLKNANCRSGPWVGENYISILRENETAELLGLNEDASWGMFKLKNDLECWIGMSLVEPVPPDVVFFPGFYPVLEHTEPPEEPLPLAEEPASEPEAQQGCMVPNPLTGVLECKIPCPDRSFAARTCP